MKRPETFTDKLWRYRGVLLVLLIPAVLFTSLYKLLPRAATPTLGDPANDLKHLQGHGAGTRFAIVFDAGSTGSRVHIFRFELEDGSLKLIKDTFEQLKPGLSAYANDPDKAAASLLPLLDLALKTVPKKLQATTPVSLMATAGLRLLPGDKADRILASVSSLLSTYPFKLAPDAVRIMDGKEEGAFAWLTLNYLLGRLTKGPSATVSAIDLGGGSVQEAFAMEPETAKEAPQGATTKLKGGKHTYHVYVHSYLGYGLMAARAKIINASQEESGHPCYPKGAVPSYEYAGVVHPIKPALGGPEFSKCADVHVQAMEVKKTCGPAPEAHCTFNGVWRGERPDTAAYYASSYLWDRAVDSGIIRDEQAFTWEIQPSEFATKAIDACGKPDVTSVSAAFPRVPADNAHFLCADLTYCTQLLTAGFRLPVSKKLTLVKQIEYNGQRIEAAWPLGAAVNDLSSM